MPALPLGPVPNLNGGAGVLNGMESLLIGAGNASGLFPAITPSATATPSPDPPGVSPHSSGPNAESVSDAAALTPGTPEVTAQVMGLLALGLAIILTVKRLSLRKRSGSGGQRG
jgi:hypothetical protein